MSTATAPAPEKSNGTSPATTEIARQPAQRIVVQDSSQFANLLDTAKYEHLWRVAQTFAASELVPAQFQKNAPNCYVAIQMAIRLGVDPFMFLQSCYVVHGRPGIEAKLAIALANKSGVFVGPIQYRLEGEGKSRKCTAYATVRETGERIEMTVDWAMVEAEGWNKKSGSKWLTMPEVMFRYRAAMMLIRTHCPEVIMGMHSADELEDAGPRTIDVSADTSNSLDALTDRLLGPQETVDRTGAHEPLSAEHRREASQVKQEAEHEPEDGKPTSQAADEVLANFQRELSAATSISISAEVSSIWRQRHPELAEPIGKLTEKRQEEIRASRGGKQMAGAN